ncbi:unnamed protein product [Calicophoron daubneyi]|uniref:Rab-GAP TBC domain-containing protein n=1 Tax=Calicophoron daubneyi TaxID=300641 RepID=A0AAV2TAK7_CALDB
MLKDQQQQQQQQQLKRQLSSGLPENPATHSEYMQDWYQCFGVTSPEKNKLPIASLEKLQEKALRGQLENSHFRSLCWRLFLGLLPPDVSHWLLKLTRQRKRFRGVSFAANRNPRYLNRLDHPLSLESSSAWQHHFLSHEIKRRIAQDVDRTFPGVEYFRDEKVCESMINILFCYVENSGFSYKQGMHEILAPVMYTLQCDIRAFQSANEKGQVPGCMQREFSTIFNPDYLEADAFLIFSQIMDTIRLWYVNKDETSDSTNIVEVDETEIMDIPQLFDFPNKSRLITNPGAAYIADIHERLLREKNERLYLHLKRLEISPSLFGLRWIRLLFGHEFPLPGVLRLWDCIFSIGKDFIFVRYIYISMLCCVSAKMLPLDFSGTLSILMHYPSDVDIPYLIALALNFYNPSSYPAPNRPYQVMERRMRNIVNQRKSTLSRAASMAELDRSKFLSLPRRHSVLTGLPHLSFLNHSEKTEVKNGVETNSSDSLNMSTVSPTPTIDVHKEPMDIFNSPSPSPISVKPPVSRFTEELFRMKIDEYSRQCMYSLDSCMMRITRAISLAENYQNSFGLHDFKKIPTLFNSYRSVDHVSGTTQIEELRSAMAELETAQSFLRKILSAKVVQLDAVEEGKISDSPSQERPMNRPDRISLPRSQSMMITGLQSPSKVDSGQLLNGPDQGHPALRRQISLGSPESFMGMGRLGRSTFSVDAD